MLELVNTNRNNVGFVEQDVDSHEDGVGIESYAAILMGFLFVLDHGIKPKLWS